MRAARNFAIVALIALGFWALPGGAPAPQGIRARRWVAGGGAPAGPRAAGSTIRCSGAATPGPYLISMDGWPAS